MDKIVQMSTPRRTRPLFYILGGHDGETPVPVYDARDPRFLVQFERGRWQITAKVRPLGIFPAVLVSTVFLGIDHAFGDGPPVLFETMIFGWPFGDGRYERRHCTVTEARAGFKEAVYLVWWPWPWLLAELWYGARTRHWSWLRRFADRARRKNPKGGKP